MSRYDKVCIGAILILSAYVGHGLYGQQAQPAAPTQQTATHLDAATIAGTNNSSAGVITFPAVGNQYFYLTAIDITTCNTALVTAVAPTAIVSANIVGLPTWTVGSGTTFGICQPTIVQTYSNGLKSAVPGTNVTITQPSWAANQTIRVNAYGFYGQ